MTAPIIEAGYLAGVLVRLEALEESLRVALEVTGRLADDIRGLEVTSAVMSEEIKTLRDAIEGRS